ncbi:MAG: dodecin family protein [Verrucomicrobia subdivision 3 bacterium]|nr:dodecin family protein [Limisphaerales bacterium]
MSVVKVIEVIAQSDKGWEDAARVAVREAAQTVRGIKSLWVKEMQAVIENGNITQYRINAKLSFGVEEARKG